jgi:F0F1-type ATP synthase assembly protein I
MDRQERPEGLWRGTLRHMHLGIQFAVTVAILVFLGYWADGKLGTRPWMILLGLGLGFGAAFYNLYREVYGRRGADDGR